MNWGELTSGSPPTPMATIQDRIRKAIDDSAPNSVAKFLSAEMLDGIVIKHCLKEQVFNFDLMSTAFKVYKWQGSQLYFAFPSYEQEDGVTYSFNPEGSIVVTIGTSYGEEARTSIAVTACACCFAEAVADCLLYLATSKAKEIAQSLGEGSVTPGSVRHELMTAASAWIGIQGLG